METESFSNSADKLEISLQASNNEKVRSFARKINENKEGIFKY